MRVDVDEDVDDDVFVDPMKMSKMIFILILMKMLMMRDDDESFVLDPFQFCQQREPLKCPATHNMQRLNYAAYITLYNLHRGSTENLCKTNIFQSHCRFFHVFHPVMFRCEAQHFSLAQWLRNEMSTAKLSSCEVLGLREARHVGLLRLIAFVAACCLSPWCRKSSESSFKGRSDYWKISGKVRYPLWTKHIRFTICLIYPFSLSWEQWSS